MQYNQGNVKECWRPIIGYEEFYEVSNFGRVKSYITNHYRPRETPLILKPCKLSKGYLGVSLLSKTFKIHRLVAQAFLPNPNNLPEVNHKDEDKTNNFYLNLEWCTTQYNLTYGTARDRINLTNKIAGSSVARRVGQYTLDGELVRKYNSISEAMKYNGFKNNSNIIQSCKSNQKVAYNYRWKYLN